MKTTMYINYFSDGSTSANLNPYYESGIDPDKITAELADGVKVLEREGGERMFEVDGERYLDTEIMNCGRKIYIIRDNAKKRYVTIATVTDELAYRLAGKGKDKKVPSEIEKHIHNAAGLIRKLYDHIGRDADNIDDIKDSWEYDYLTVNTGRDGKTYLWFADEFENCAICEDGTIVDDEKELDKLFC